MAAGGMEIEQHAKGDFDDDGKKRRTGTVWTAAAHIITAVIGSGVLSLAWSTAQMGWIGGPVMLALFAWCTYFTSRLLTDCYRHPDPVTGERCYIYMESVRRNLSKTQYYVCGLVQYSNLIGVSVGYTIATATSARSIQKTDCRHEAGSPDAPCLASTTLYIGIFGLIQIVFSQIPNFGEIWWLSYLASVMSFAYSTIILGLAIAKAATKSSHDYGTLDGVGHVSQTQAQQIWNVLIALGNIAFAYSYSMILIEIQDTLRSPPAENKQMKRATLYGISTTTFFYLTVGVAGYAAFGNDVPGNILTAFNSPYWLVDFANACVVVHLVGAYQVYSQPVFQFFETFVSKRYPQSAFLSKEYPVTLIPGCDPFKVNLFRSLWRTGYVVVMTVTAMVLPFFNDILGILGALGFWPLTVYFPIAMYSKVHKIQRGTRTWWGLQTLSFVTFLISMGALVGSVEGIIMDLRHISLFKAS